MFDCFPMEASKILSETPKEFLRDPAEVEAIRRQVREYAAKRAAEETKKPRVSSAYLFGYLIGQRDAEYQKGYRDGFREAMR